jgi:UDP-N-acetylmuramoyl-tripeptide--D-alanyl-D-alanine ligase
MFLHINDILNILYKKSILDNIPINGISIDSRTIKCGEVFFALKGVHYDGHLFIKEAIQKGASAIICSNKYNCEYNNTTLFPLIIKIEDPLVALGKVANKYRSKFTSTKIIAITGSNGKTTTKDMLFEILKTNGKTIASKKNFNNRIGLPISMFNLNYNIKYAVFELGSSLCGEIKLLTNILNPDIGLITNIGDTHLESFISSNGVFLEKKSLFDNMKKKSIRIINNDDKFLKLLNNKYRTMTFSLNNTADVYVKNIKFNFNATSFVLCYKNKQVNIKIATKERFNILNALAASSCAICLGISLKNIKYGLEKFILPPMRMERLITRQGLILINDAYNANPSSMKEAITSVIETYSKKKIYLILGDMLELGPKANKYHFELGMFINSKKNIAAVYLLGIFSLYIKQALRITNVFHFHDKINLLNKLKITPIDNNSVLFFKGSRLVQMETLYINIVKLYFCKIN